MFVAEMEPAPEAGRRLSPRRRVALRSGVRSKADNGGLTRALCTVVDLSLRGARLHTHVALRRGSAIWLTLPDIGQVVADVIWADDYAAGCLFREPLAPEQFEALTAID